MLKTVTILGGQSRTGEPETVRRIDLHVGEVLAIVGPTGSGKTTLVNDLELFADGTTSTRRRILVDGEPPPSRMRDEPSASPIALITQHTSFLSDLPVAEFLLTHARIRRSPASAAEVVEKTLAFANELTGEPVDGKSRMTDLSGGQTRALLIADATVVCDTPIVLLDEVENAGIDRARALELLRRHRKAFVYVTHDPHIALLADARLVMKGGAMTAIIQVSEADHRLASVVGRMDAALARVRETIRAGETLSGCELEAFA
ncbi:MAG: ATP-binding cassette domain-containing protein [Thermoanaerobaculia bacterium]